MSKYEDRASVRGAVEGTRNFTTFPLIIGALLFIAMITVVGYLAGWWLKEEAVNREAEINRNSFEFQESNKDRLVDLNDDIKGVDVQLADPAIEDEHKGALIAQRAAMVDSLCGIAADLNEDGLTQVHRNIIMEEC